MWFTKPEPLEPPMTRFLPLFALAACTQSSTEPAEIHTWTSDASGFDTTSTWVDDGEQVIVFDAQFTPELAAELLADIQAETGTPISTVVATHPNPDKFLGASVFQDAGASFVASEATADALAEVYAYKKAWFVGVGMFTDESFPALPTVDQTFTDTLDLGPAALRVLDHGGVTTTQTVGIVGDDLIVGDLVAGRVHAWLEGGIVDGAATPDIAAWRAALDDLPGLASGEVYPGRGEVLPVGTAVSEQRDYLEAMDLLVADYVAGLADPLAELSGTDGATHWANLSAEAEAAFPEHGLSYLVTYGVYGLAFQHAAE